MIKSTATETVTDQQRRLLEDKPMLARLQSDAGLQKSYKQALDLLDAINFDAIMREVADASIGEPPAGNEGALLCRALTEEQRTGFHKARRAMRNFLVLQTMQDNIPNTPDYGSSDALRRLGYDPDKIQDQDD